MNNLAKLAIFLGVCGTLMWWFNWSPPAQRCFERGGTSFDIDGSCLQITVQKR